MIREKEEFLASLQNMEVIYGFLDEDSGVSNSIDICYRQLKVDITLVEKSSAVYVKIYKSFKNLHGPTHSSFSHEVLEVFQDKRNGEDDRFAAFEDLENQRLLWHGSRSINFANILANGLMISPVIATGM